MDQIFEIVKEWPVIVQGALGSALFWLVLLAFQKLSNFGASFFSNFSKKERIAWLISRHAKHEAFGGTDNNSLAAYATSALIYRSLRYAYRGFTWLGLGLIGFFFTDISLIVGGSGLIYYFLKAYEVVSPFKDGENTPEAWLAVEKELIDLEALPSAAERDETNNSMQPTANAATD